MSVTQEAQQLRRPLFALYKRGQHLLKQETISLEQAHHFRELADAYMYNIDSPVASLEAHSTPEQHVQATMEGIGQVLGGLMRLLTGAGKKADKPAKKKEIQQELDGITEMNRKLQAGYENAAWLANAKFVQGTITLPKRAGVMLYRDNHRVQTVEELIKEVQKDLGEYQAIFRTFRGISTTYVKWCNETWAGSVKNWEQYGKNGELNQLFDAQKDWVEKQLNKRPPSPLEKTNIAPAARLGYPAPDVWVKEDKHAALGKIFDITIVPSSKGNDFTMPGLDKESFEKVKSLFGDVIIFWSDIFDFVEDKLHGAAHFDGFDDYPFRNETMMEATIAADDLRSETFDRHFYYDGVAGLYAGLSERVECLYTALYDYMSRAFTTQP